MMDNKPKLSVFIITKNEEDRLPLALKSVIDWVDEVLIIDCYSQDNTVTVAENMGAKIFLREWTNYGEQKKFGESLCSNDWILNIDADEYVSEELKQEIQALFAKGSPPFFAYQLNIKALLFGQKAFSLSPCNQAVRLYHRQEFAFRNNPVHDSVIPKLSGLKLGQLQHTLYHNSYRSYSHTIEKIHAYTTMQALEWFNKKRKKPSLLRLYIEFPAALFKSLFIRRYVFFGTEGFFISMLYAYSKLIRLLKTRELYNNN